MARGERLLDRGGLVVDASVQHTGPEEGGLGAGRIEDVHQVRRVDVRAVVVGESQHARLSSLLDYHAGGRALGAASGRTRGHQQPRKNSSGEHLERWMWRFGV